MNTYKVLIIDDEEPARKLISSFLNENKEFEIIGECADGFTAVKQINEQLPDVVFLDIQMPKLTGLEVIELIDKNPLIVFVTAYDEFAVKAFEMNAVDYLLKPYSKQRFAEMILKVKEKLNLQTTIDKNYEKLQESITQNQTITRIAVKTGAKIDVLLIENILMFEAQDDYVQIYTEKTKYLKNIKMKYLEENLPKVKFLRIHRSYIVNTDYVEKIEKAEKESFYVILKNNIVAKATKQGFDLIKQQLNL